MQRKSLFSGGNALPSLAPVSPSPAPAPSQAEEKPTATKTGEWLLDGINQLEADSKNTRADQRTQEARDTGPETSDNAGAVSPINPFADYLTRWMRPEDHRLLLGETSQSSPSILSDWSGPRPEAGAVGGGRSPLTPSLTPQMPGLDFTAQSQPPANPYLSESVAVDAPRLLPEPSSPAPEGPASLPPMGFSAAPSPAQAPAPRVEQAQPTPVVSPTSRLVDDRKYFPQLRRF
jgi:hypothetical protein